MAQHIRVPGLVDMVLVSEPAEIRAFEQECKIDRQFAPRGPLVSRASQDRWAMHGTAIGMHGIVHALERMRELRASSEAASLGEEAIMGRCLAPPNQVPRTVEAMLSVPVTAKSLRPGTVVMLQ